MSFQPVVPIAGYSGWKFLERTLDNQQAAFSNSEPVSRATSYFAQNIGNVRTAADLVADRQLLSVALGAFGLDDDINNRFFIQSILEGGTVADDALANRLADSRYADFSRSFGFGNLEVQRTGLPGFAQTILERYEKQQFAQAVGTQNNDLRLALNVSEGLDKILADNSTNTGRWFAVMGNPPLRQVFETALALPSGIVNIELDQQRDIFEERALSVLGSGDVADLADPKAQEDLIRLFLVRAEAAALSAVSPQSTALTLLQNAPLRLS